MGLTKVVACFVVALLVVGREVSAGECLDHCFINCIGYESDVCMLKCYIKCKWVESNLVANLVENLTPEEKAKLREIEEGEGKAPAVKS